MNEPKSDSESREKAVLNDALFGFFSDETPITEEWLLEQGFQQVPSDRGPNFADHFEKGPLNLWEFNGTGNWLWDEHDSVDMRTRGKLRLLAAWLDIPLPNASVHATGANEKPLP